MIVEENKYRFKLELDVATGIEFPYAYPFLRLQDLKDAQTSSSKEKGEILRFRGKKIYPE